MMEDHKNREKRHEDKRHEERKHPPAADGGKKAAASPGGADDGSAPAQAAPEAPDYYGQLLSLKADFENYRKRVEKEKPELVKFGKAQLLLALLPLYDLLTQAHLHISMAAGGEDPARLQEVVKGLEMIFREFSKVFEAEGIRPMETVGKPYDPMASEIIGIDEGTEENDGFVTGELQKGFFYGDKILRPARVKIAKKKAAPPASPAEEKTQEPKQEQKPEQK